MEPGDIMGFEDGCAEEKLCPAPMYFQKGEYKGVYSNNADFPPVKGDDDFGLDVVEDIFKYPIGNWEDFGPFKTALKYDVPYNQAEIIIALQRQKFFVVTVYAFVFAL